MNRDERDDEPVATSGEEEPAESERRGGYTIDRDRGDGDDERVDRPTVNLPDEEETASSPEPGSGGGSSPPEPPEPPDPKTVRNWTALTAVLAAVALASAAAIALTDGPMDAAAGAVVLGLGLGAIALAGQQRPTIVGDLSDAWAEHRLYVWFSTGLFALGIGFGVVLYAAGIDLTELFLEMIMEEFGEDELPGDGELADEGHLELSASFFIANNTPPFLAAIVGALTVGFLTVVIMVFNGILIGNIVAATGAEVGFGVVAALLVPHGIFELPALFVAAGVGFRFLHRAVQRILGTREALFTRSYLRRTAALVVFAWLVLVLAAFVEAYVTFLVADALFPAQT